MKRIESYRHEPEKVDVGIDPRPGDYFVYVFDRVDNIGRGMTALLSGPYVDHLAAIEDSIPCRKALYAFDERAAFYSFGTCRLPVGSGRRGWLQKMGLRAIPAVEK